MSEQQLPWMTTEPGKPLGRWRYTGDQLPLDWPQYVDVYQRGLEGVVLVLPDGRRRHWTLRGLQTMYTREDRPQAYPGGAPYVRASATSREAAESQAGGVHALRREVLKCLVARGAHGGTDDEMEMELGMLHQTLSARRRELVLERLVVASDRKRVTRTGRRATVWVVTPAAVTGALLL